MTVYHGRQRVSSPYGPRIHPIYGTQSMHNGKDIVGIDSKEQRLVVKSAKVLSVNIGYNGGRGNNVVLQSINDAIQPNADVRLRYQHQSSTTLKVGDVLSIGDIVGIEGSTGDSTGSHCHFEVTVNGTAVDPSPWDGLPNVAGEYDGSDDGSKTLIYGVDVSRHQRFNAIKEIVATGKADFAILRVCVADMYIDDYFDVFYRDAKDNLKLGYYSANYFTTVPNAIKEADYTVNYLEKIGIATPDLPIFVDWEGFSYDWYVKKFEVPPSNELIRDMTEAYVNRIKERGYVAGIYLNRDYYNNKYGTAFMDKMIAQGIWVWLADPSNPTTPLIECDIHQYEVANGIDYGYTGGDLDKNKLYRDYLTQKPSGGDFDKMLIKSFGSKNMQGFNFPDANTAVAYDHMPNGYRVVTQRGISGTDNASWEWIKLLDERDGKEIYTPLLSDRNQLLDDAPLLEPSSTPGGDCENCEQLALAEETLKEHMILLNDRETRLTNIKKEATYE